MSRRALLSVAVSLTFAATSHAGVPDPDWSTIPNYIYVVGYVNGGSTPDPFGAGLVIIRDPFTGELSPQAEVTFDFSGCCDIALCSAVMNGQVVDCTGNLVTGITDGDGRLTFTIMGAGTDPGNVVYPDEYGGCSSNAVTVRFRPSGGGTFEVRRNGVLLDQNGAATGGSNGVSIGDVANLFNTFGAYAAYGIYRARGDLNADNQITVADISALFSHYGRLVFAGGTGCAVPYCTQPSCP